LRQLRIADIASYEEPNERRYEWLRNQEMATLTLLKTELSTILNNKRIECKAANAKSKAIWEACCAEGKKYDSIKLQDISSAMASVKTNLENDGVNNIQVRKRVSAKRKQHDEDMNAVKRRRLDLENKPPPVSTEPVPLLHRLPLFPPHPYANAATAPPMSMSPVPQHIPVHQGSLFNPNATTPRTALPPPAYERY